MKKESSRNFVQDVPKIVKDVIKLLQPVSSQGVRNNSRIVAGTCNFAGLSRELHELVAEKNIFRCHSSRAGQHERSIVCPTFGAEERWQGRF